LDPESCRQISIVKSGGYKFGHLITLGQTFVRKLCVNDRHAVSGVKITNSFGRQNNLGIQKEHRALADHVPDVTYYHADGGLGIDRGAFARVDDGAVQPDYGARRARFLEEMCGCDRDRRFANGRFSDVSFLGRNQKG
jgi:hypothetical protein